jgi:hypothetical protein
MLTFVESLHRRAWGSIVHRTRHNPDVREGNAFQTERRVAETNARPLPTLRRSDVAGSETGGERHLTQADKLSRSYNQRSPSQGGEP